MCSKILVKEKVIIMKVTFCGHSKLILHNVILKKYAEILIQLIEEGANEFLLGGYGSFDSISANLVHALKKTYPYIHSTLVTAYINQEKRSDIYDDIEYPPIENVPLKFAINKRNEWMVDNSDVVISYVKAPVGGAAKTLEYAKRKRKRIIDLAEICSSLSKSMIFINIKP